MSVWVALAFGELPSVLAFVGGTIVLGSITFQAVAGIRGLESAPGRTGISAGRD